jgi:cell division septum initiation protein DivIVA
MMTSHERDTEAMLLRVRELVETARQMPLSASVMVNRDEILDLLDDAIARLPEELRQARWLLKEREEFLAKARREGDEILDAARSRAERMVQRTEVVRDAERQARAIVERADTLARQMRNEAEDYVDHKLAAFEVVLDRTLQTVQRGRQKLQVQLAPADPDGVDVDEPAFFDQDQLS